MDTNKTKPKTKNRKQQQQRIGIKKSRSQLLVIHSELVRIP